MIYKQHKGYWKEAPEVEDVNAGGGTGEPQIIDVSQAVEEITRIQNNVSNGGYVVPEPNPVFVAALERKREAVANAGAEDNARFEKIVEQITRGETVEPSDLTFYNRRLEAMDLESRKESGGPVAQDRATNYGDLAVPGEINS